MGKNRRGKRGKKSNKPVGPPTMRCPHNNSDEYDETDIACYVFTEDGFYTTNDPEVIEQNNRDMEEPAPPLYIQCKGKKWRDLHQEIRFKSVFDFSVKCLDNDKLLELQLGNMYDYKAVRPKIAQYIVSKPENTEKAEEEKKTEETAKTEEKEKTEQEETEEQKTEEKKKKKKKSPPIKALLRGLPWLCDEEGVREGLLYEGFGDVAVKLHNRTNKSRPALFILAVDTDEDKKRRKDPDKIFELTKIMGFQVTVEPLTEEFDPKPQCFKCQQEGHVAKYCRNRAICVKCAGFHDSRDCPLKKDDQPTCARCGGPHVASWRGCKAFLLPGFTFVFDSSEEDGDSTNSSEDDETTEPTISSAKTPHETTEQANSACAEGGKKKRKKRLGKTASALAAQDENADQVKEEETTDQPNCSQKTQLETTGQANPACEEGAKKRKRRKKRRGKLASPVPAQGEGGQLTASPPRDQLADSGSGGGNRPGRQGNVAVLEGDAKTENRPRIELEGEVAAAVAMLTQQMSASVLETLTAVLKAAK